MHLTGRIRVLLIVAVTISLVSGIAVTLHDRVVPVAAQGSASPTSSDEPAVIFSDDFESGSLDKWSTVDGLKIGKDQAATGNASARATSASGSPAYARVDFSGGQKEVLVRIWFNVLGLGDNSLDLIQFRTPHDQPIFSVFVEQNSKLGVRNDVAG